MAQSLFQTPEGRRLYQEKCAVLYTNSFRRDALTNRVWEVAARLEPVFDSAEKAARDMCDRVVRRAQGIEMQLNSDWTR